MPSIHRLDRRLAHMPNSILKLVASIDELKGRWFAGAQLSPQILGTLKRSVLVTSSGSSTRIEGASLSDAEVDRLMRGISIRKLVDRSEQEVRGYFELLQTLFEAWMTVSFTESSIQHLHKEMLKYVEKDAWHRGKYKQTDNAVTATGPDGSAVVVFETTPPYLTSKAMEELVPWTQRALLEAKYHPLLVIGSAMVEFLAIHPFQDGNGRLSRLLTNLLLLRAGYAYVPYVSHEKLIEGDKRSYYIALRSAQKTFGTKRETIVPWLTFFLRMLERQAEQAIALLSRTSIEQQLSEKQLAILHYVEHTREASTSTITAALKIARPTVVQALAKLLRLKLVDRIGLGRSTRYRRASPPSRRE